MRGLFRGFVIMISDQKINWTYFQHVLLFLMVSFEGKRSWVPFLTVQPHKVDFEEYHLPLISWGYFAWKVMIMLVQRQVLLTPLGEVQYITLLNASIKNDWTTLWLGWEDTAPNETMMKRFWLQVCYQSCWWLVAVFLDREETKRKRQVEVHRQNLPFALCFLSIEKNCNKPARYWPGTPWMLCAWIIQILQVQACQCSVKTGSNRLHHHRRHEKALLGINCWSLKPLQLQQEIEKLLHL